MTKPDHPLLPVTVRDARDDDMAAVHAIYTYYVAKTAASFEETPPDLDEMLRRREATRARDLPYLVAECDGEVLGYSYAGPFRSRSAYRYTLEDSIYVAPLVVRRGIGKALLGELCSRCTGQGYRQMIGIIGDSANIASISVHRAMGFRQEGVLRGVGLKFGRWIDIVIMHRPLGSPEDPPPGAAAL